MTTQIKAVNEPTLQNLLYVLNRCHTKVTCVLTLRVDMTILDLIG